MRRFTKLADNVTPADCGLDFEGYLVTTITSHHRIFTELVTVSLADSTEDCTGIRRGNDASYRERESANDTHHAHSKMTGSRPETSIDQNFIFGVTTHFGQSTLGT